MRYSVLTYIFDGYEHLHEIQLPQDDVEYICVTDDKSMQSKTWKIVHDDTLEGLDTFEKCYRVRFNPFKYCTTDVCVRIDGSMKIIGSLDNIVEDFNKGQYDTCVMVHPERTALKEEYDVWCNSRGYDRHLADDALEYCTKHGYDVDNYKGLYQFCFAIYRNNNVNKELNEQTYKALKEIGGNIIHRIDQTIYSYIVNTYTKPIKLMCISQNYCVHGQSLRWCAHNSNQEHNLPRISMRGYVNNKLVDLYTGTRISVVGDKNKPLCVFSVPMCSKGELICEEMLEWLKKDFCVHIVRHDGSLFEYFGIKYMQDLCLKEKKSCMYIHTKGAYNNHDITKTIRTFWRTEYSNDGSQKYFDAIAEDKPMMSCSFTGNGKAPWYNCFFANWQAMKEIGEIKVTDNRFYYEDGIFRDTNVTAVGLIMNNIHLESTYHAKMHEWLFAKYPTRNMEVTDIVYLLGNGSKWQNNELRYSLRSIDKYGSNIGNIFVVGEYPVFTNSFVKYIRMNDIGNKAISIYRKIEAAVNNPNVRDCFLVSSDDHFYTKPIDFYSYPNYHFGLIEDYIKTVDKSNPQYELLAASLRCLKERDLPCYLTNPHCNTRIDKTIWRKYSRDIEEMMQQGCLINCVIGNLMIKEGYKFVEIKDCKLREPHTYNELQKIFKDNHCVSIGDAAINDDFARFMSDFYRTPSEYEKNNSTPTKKEQVIIQRYQKKYPACDVWIEGKYLCIRKKGRQGAPTRYTL